MWYIWKIIIWLILVVCFGGVIAFVPYVLWIFSKAFFMPIEIISQTIYPVWTLPYLIWFWGFAFFIGKFLLHSIVEHI